ncbi:hypothetical protein DERP_000522 [Dermatophagoides pteronyssinus]|uniref:Uncharacterized protein n=1 Tax=Dermatophagoides pteronyssinus TaxID=6956 RepID=A0ABQ8J0D7_DERPT|nr:hypothetical protein DERP_000522 [Dermatophagoides pteronyssinus]
MILDASIGVQYMRLFLQITLTRSDINFINTKQSKQSKGKIVYLNYNNRKHNPMIADIVE